MPWFRSHRLKVAWLALFALACQFVLSFGHLHLGRFAGNSTNWVAAAAGKTDTAPAVNFTLADLSLLPLEKNRNELGVDFCAICASINLADALVVPPTPAVPTRISFFNELRWSFAAREAPSIDRIHVGARGPPSAPETTA